MNRLWKFAGCALRFGTGNLGGSSMLTPFNSNKTVSLFSRTMWYMCSSNSNRDNKFFRLQKATELRHFGSSGQLHAKGEKCLVDYLKSEIGEERKSQKMKSLPKALGDFSITASGAELQFKKQNDHETIVLSMNVNHSIDSEGDGAVEEEEYAEEMQSRPNFEIVITRNNAKLGFFCSYVQSMEVEEDKSDVFQIDEISFYEGEWNNKNYSVAGDILDDNLYELFMTFLHEKGITNELIQDVSEVATFYEHSKYIDLLEQIQKFASSN